MATPIQRVQVIVNALIDGTATTAQLNKVADAYVFAASDAEILDAFNTTKALLTSNQKAQVVLESLRRIVKQSVRYQAEQAGYAALAAQVAADVDAASQGL